MKVELKEYSGCFCISLIAETVDDANRMARMAMNRTKEVRSCTADAYSDGTFCADVVLGKRKNAVSTIKEG